MSTPTLEDLMQMVNETKKKRTVLDQVAATASQNRGWRQPGDTNSTLEYAMGSGNSPVQNRGLNQLYGSILNRAPGQTAIGAATGGFEKGSALMDEIRAKEKGEKVFGAQTGVDNAAATFKESAGVYDLGRKERDADIDKQNLALRAGELRVKQGTLGLKADTEAWKREHPDMSVNTEKVYREYNTQEIDANRKTNKFKSLASQLRDAKYPGGARTWGEEQLKSMLGEQDQQTALIEAGRNLTVSEAINSLPPGVASDKDIELVMGTVPSQFSDPEYLANYAEARSRLEKFNAEYAAFVQSFMEQNKEKNYSMVGVNTAWKIHKIPSKHKELLERNADNEEAIAAFEKTYGPGMAEKVLAQ